MPIYNSWWLQNQYAEQLLAFTLVCRKHGQIEHARD